MRLLTYTGEIDVDIHDVTMKIDGIFHDEITDKSGVTISHRGIIKFVVGLIQDNNKDVMEFRRKEKELDDLMQEFEDQFDATIKKGKVVEDLNGFWNKFKFYCLGYTLYKMPIGCEDRGYVVKCEECVFDYNDIDCKNIRNEGGCELVFD